jgi:hypothetical protein
MVYLAASSSLEKAVPAKRKVGNALPLLNTSDHARCLFDLRRLPSSPASRRFPAPIELAETVLSIRPRTPVAHRRAFDYSNVCNFPTMSRLIDGNHTVWRVQRPR